MAFIPGLFCKVVSSSNLYFCSSPGWLSKKIRFGPQPLTCKYAYYLGGFNKNIVTYRPQFCKFDVPSSSMGSYYIFLPLGTSNLQTWGQFGKGWGHKFDTLHCLFLQVHAKLERTEKAKKKLEEFTKN